MFEGVLERLLLKLFGEYVEEFNRDQLHVSIWAGDVVLTDLKLKAGALDSLRLPLEVVAGGIATLTLKIPWTRIASAPCQIVIDGLYLIAGPVSAKKGADGDDAAADPAGVFAAQKLAVQLKARMLETHEASKRALAESADGGAAASSSYSSRMISKIIANLQLTVKHVHFRYEDFTTLQGAANITATPSSSTAVALAAPASPSALTSPSAFACGFTISELVAQTTDSKGEVKFVSGADSNAGSGGEDDPAAVTHKIVALRGGSVYWNSEVHASDLWQHLPAAERIKRMRQMDSTIPSSDTREQSKGRPALPAGSPPPASSSPKLLCDYDYILHPLDITMRAVLHHGDDDRELLRAQETEHLLMQAQSAQTAAAAAAASATGATTAFAFPTPVPVPSGSSGVAPSTAKYFFSFTLPHLSLQLRSAQYRDAVRILDHFSQTKVNNTIALRMAKLPRFPPRDRTAAQMAARKRSGSIASSRTGSRPPSPGMGRAGGGDQDLADNISEADTNDWGDSQSVSATDDDDTDEEFLTPEQAPLNEPANDMDSLSLDGDSGTRLSAASLSSISSLPSSFAPAPRFFRPAWCRPYWRHACRCLILLKSRRGRMEWSSVMEFGVDRARYIALWMRSYNSALLGATNNNAKTKAQAKAASASWLPALSATELQELAQLEAKLSFESIVVFRLIAEQQWKVQQQAASTMAAPAEPAPSASPPAAAAAAASASSKKPTAPPAGGGWWNYLGFKAAEGGSGSSAVDAEAAKLIQSITLTPQQQRAIWEQEQSLPLYFKRLQIHVQLFGADFRLTQPRKGAKAAAAAAAASSAILSPTSPTQLDLRSNRPPEFEVTRLTWDGSLVFVQRLRTWSAAVNVTKMEVIDCCTEGTCFPKVISTGTDAVATAAAVPTTKPAPAAPLLSLYLEDSPRLLDAHSSADFRVRLELSPLAFVVSPLYLSAVLRFFSEKDTTAFLWAAAANWEAQARSDLLNALTDHREIDFDLCVHNPTVLLPTDCLRRDSTVLVSDLQLLRMLSKPPIKHKAATKRPDAAEPSPLDPFSDLSSSVDANLSYVAPSNPQAYDSFQLHFKDCRLYTCSSVAQWERRNALRLSYAAAAAMPVDAASHEELLYIVDGAVNDDARIPAANSAHAPAPSMVLPRRLSGSRSLHAHPGFDVSLVMHTCIDKFERLRAKHARDLERARAAQVQELIARGDHDGLHALQPLPPAKPLSKILIQGSLPFINISVCASTLQVIRNVKTQLMGLWLKAPANTANATTGAAAQTQEQADMLQLANESAPAASAGAGGSSARSVPVGDASSASKPDAALTSMVQLSRNNLECGFLVDQLVVNILRDRVLRNAKAAAAAQSSSSSTPAATPMSFLRPKAPPLFLFHITRMGGVFVTSAAREIHSSFQLASIRVLDCLQPFGPGSSKFAYLACSYPIPGSDEAARHDTGDGRSHAASRPHSAGIQPSSSSENLQFSFAQALSRAVAPSRVQVPSASPASSALSSPSPSSASSDLIRIRYQYIFTPARNEREWEEEEGGDSEEDFLKHLSKPRHAHSTNAPTAAAPSSPATASAAPQRAEGVASTIDLDFNTLYVSWNPNTVAAVLAYLRYDESKLAEKETAAVLGGAAVASAAAAASEGKEAAESKPETTSSRKDASDALYGDSSTAAGPSFSTAPASSSKGPRPNAAMATPSAAGKAKKTVRLAPSAPAGPISLTTALSSNWFAAHKNTTVVRARLRRLSVTFNKEAEGRQLMRLEMVHSSVEHRHTVHPSPFLFYLITTKSTAKGKSHPGFISEAAKTSAIAAAGSAGVASLASLSASLSRDPIHTFVTRGSLGNVKLVDLSEDFGVESKYRETFGLREEKQKAHHERSASVSAPVEEKEDSLASVLDFSFASFQLEVKQRREWAIRKRREIELQRRRDAGDESAEPENVSPVKPAAATPTASNLPSRFPSQPSFADTHLLLHVNAIRVVYLQQHTMELIDYFNEGILGALQARLRQPSKAAPSPNPATVAASPAQDKYNKLSISLSSPELIVPRNSQSDHHLVASIGKVKVSNTLHARRLVLGVDIKSLRICSGELNADGTYDARSHSSYAAAAAAGAHPGSIQIRPHRDSPGFVRAPMLDFDCFVTSTLPQPDPLKQPANEKYFDSILDLDMGTLRGVMSWAQYLLILQVWNENLRAPPPVRQKLHVPVQIVLEGAAGPPLGGAPIPSAIRPPGASHIVPVVIPARDGVLSPSATPSLTDAPTVTYHVFDDRPPLTMDIRLHITLARLRFLVGDGYVSTGSSGWREDGLSEISVVDISYVFQKFSSNHMHQTARVASVTMTDTRHASRNIPFSKMLCPFADIRGGGHKEKPAQPAHDRVERVGTVASAVASASAAAPSTPSRPSSLPPPAIPARASSVNESELVYVQHDYPTGERDMHMSVIKPCGFIIPDFWGEFIFGFLFKANDESILADTKMKQEWERRTILALSSDPASPGAAPASSSSPRAVTQQAKPASSPRPPLSTTTGVHHAGYTPTPFAGAVRPFRAFNLTLKNSRLILVEDLRYRACRALVTTCDATMNYASFEAVHKPPPAANEPQQSSPWWTSFQWSRIVTIRKLRVFVAASAQNPIINAAHSVMTPANLVHKQSSKTEKRYYQPRANMPFHVSSLAAGGAGSAGSPGSPHGPPELQPVLPPLRLEVRDEQVHDVSLCSSAEGQGFSALSGSISAGSVSVGGGEPIEVRASYQDFKLISHCLDTLAEQQRIKQEERLAREEAEAEQKAAANVAAADSQLDSAPNPHLSSMLSDPSKNLGLDDGSSGVDSTEDEFDDGLMTPRPPAASPPVSSPLPSALANAMTTFSESATVLHVVWSSQLTLVIINDCFQRYVPLLHARILPGEALWIFKRKELDDEADEDEDEEAEDEEEEEQLTEEEAKARQAAEAEASSTAGGDGSPAPVKLSTLDRARSFLHKLKHGDKPDPSASPLASPPPRRPRALQKKLVDFKTLATTLLLECTFFNPRVVVWEPLVEPLGIEIKAQYETPNIHNSLREAQSRGAFGKVGQGAAANKTLARRSRAGPGMRSTGDGVPLLPVNNVPAWTVHVLAASRVNVNLSYVFLQHLYSTLQSWSEDFQSGRPSQLQAELDASGSSKPSNSQAFSPYFIRNLTGGEVLYRCRNIIRESAKQAAAAGAYGATTASSSTPSASPSSAASATSNAFALHDRITLNSEFAANPGQFIGSIGATKPRHSSVALASMDQDDPESKAAAASSSPDDQPDTAAADLDEGLETVHVLAPGAEEQLSLRLISGQSSRKRRGQGGAGGEEETSAEDDVYRSILASRAPFSLRVRLAGGWVALQDLVVSKVGTTSYVLQLDAAASTFKVVSSSAGVAGSKSPLATHAANVSGASTVLSSASTPSPQPLALGLAAAATTAPAGELIQSENLVISDYFPTAEAPKSATAAGGIGSSLAMALQSGAQGGGAAAGADASSSAARALHAAGAVPGQSSATAAALPAVSMLHMTQLERRQLLLVDVSLRDGSKVVTLRAPIELVNRTDRPICFLLHAHPTTPRRAPVNRVALAAAASSSGPYPDWAASHSAYLQARDAFAVLGPVAPGQSVHVPFSLTHLDFVSAMPMRKGEPAPSSPPTSAANQAAAMPGAQSSASALLRGAGSIFDGRHAGTQATDVSGSAAGSQGCSYGWSDAPLSQSALMKAVQEQAQRYSSVRSDQQPPGVVAKMQCSKDAAADATATGQRWRADSSFLLHVQAIHGSSGRSSSTSGSHHAVGGGARIGENVLTLSLVFTAPLVLRNLFPYGIDFRVAYTRAPPASALASQAHLSHSSSLTGVGLHAGQQAQHVLGVGSATQQQLQATAAAAAAAEKDKKKSKSKDSKPAPGPSRLDTAHAHTDGKARYELWGHLAPGQHIFMPHLSLDRDPYLMFRLDGLGWSERVPLVHLNANDSGLGVPDAQQAAAAASKSAPGQPQHDYTLTPFQMQQHIARHHVSLEDSNGNPLVAQLESRRSGPQGGGLELDLFAQYWLLNRTGLDLLYGSRIQQHVEDVPSSDATHPADVRTLPGHGGRVEVVCYENQRYSVLDGWIDPFLPTDRPAWSDEAGESDRPREGFRLPSDDGSWVWENDWSIDYGNNNSSSGGPTSDSGVSILSLDETDPSMDLAHSSKDGSTPKVVSSRTDGLGWEYALDFPFAFHPRNAMMDAVRRRRWVRSYTTTRTLRPLCLHSTNVKGWHEELAIRVAPSTKGAKAFAKEMHTKSGAVAPLLRVRASDSNWSTAFAAEGNSDGLLQITEVQLVDVTSEADLEAAKWKRAAAHVMALADSGLEKGKFELEGSEESLGPLHAHVVPRASYPRRNRYDLGVQFSPCPGLFHRSSLIAFTPRFILVNQLPYGLFFRQAGAHHRGRVMVQCIEPGRFQPLWWGDIGVQPLGAEDLIKGILPAGPDAKGASSSALAKPTKLTSAEFEARKFHIRSQNADFESLASVAFASEPSPQGMIRWRWTGAFPIDEVGELSLACRSSAMTSRFLRVKVSLDGATVYIAFREEDPQKPKYRIDNATNCPMWYRQKLPYVEENRIQILEGLSMPTPPPAASGAAGSLSPPSSSPSSNPAGSPRPLISADALSPWLYLAPGASTPFAWQELLVAKPYKLEVVTASPHLSNQAAQEASEVLARAAAQERRERSGGGAETTEEKSSPSPNPVTSFFTRTGNNASAVAAANAKRSSAAQAMAAAEAQARARLGPYDFHLADSIQLDEIGYSLVEMHSQTFVDVYVEDTREKDKQSSSSSKSKAAAAASSSSGDNDSSKRSGKSGSTTTKILKLVRKSGLRELGVAEAAALLSKEERAEREAVAARKASTGDGKKGSKPDPKAKPAPSAAELSSTPSKQRARSASSAAGDQTGEEYVPVHVHRRELQVERTSLHLSFNMAKFSLSLVDHIPRELALISLRDLSASYSSSNIYQKFELLLGDIQLDNQTPEAMFPVVLHQKLQASRAIGSTATPSEKEKARRAAKGGVQANARRPFLHLSLIRLTRYSSLEHFKYLGFLAQEFVLRVEQSFLLACIPFLDVFLAPRAESLRGEQQARRAINSLRDLEEELGLPLANEEEYKAARPAITAGATAAQTLEQEFQSQVDQMAHLRAVLATHSAQLAQERHATGAQASPNAQTSQSRLEAEIERAQTQYARLAESNQRTAAHIQDVTKRALLAAANAPSPPASAASSSSSSSTLPRMTPAAALLLEQSLLASSEFPSTPSGGPARSAHVLSTSVSWIEGADIPREEVRTKHGGARSAATEGSPYTGWMDPNTTQAAAQMWRAVNNSTAASSSAAAASSSSSSAMLSPIRVPAASAAAGASSAGSLSPLPASPRSPLSPHSSVSLSPAPAGELPPLHRRWVNANSNQNANVSKTLTALVNRTLAKLESKSHRKKARNAAAAQPSAQTIGGVKHTEDEELDQIYYLESVDLNTVQCTFSFFTLPSSSGHSSSSTWMLSLGTDHAPELLSAHTQALANAISSKTLMIANAEDAHLRVTGLRITHSFITVSELISLLSAHYQRQLQLQLFELVGSSHALGNPIGLLSNLGTGVFDLVNEPLSGAIRGPAAFGRGVAVGVGSFVKYSVRGVANTASSLLGTLGNASATLSADPDYLRRRKLGRLRQPAHAASGLLHGGRHLAKGMFDGLTGVFTSPVEGAIRGGALGFLGGVGRGLVGVVVKPVTGVFDAVTTLSDGIKNTTTLFDHRVLPQRPPRIMYGPEQLLRVYTSKEISASCFLDTRGLLRLEKHQRETYVDHLAMEMHPSKALFKENEMRIKLAEKAEKEKEKAEKHRAKEDAHSARTAPGSPTSSSLSPSAPSTPSSTRSRPGSNASSVSGGGLGRSSSESDLSQMDESSLHGVPSSRHVVPSAITSGASSSALLPPAAEASSTSALDICFCLTDHSFVCLKLDLKGNLAASMNNSSSSSARASTASTSATHVGQSGGHISSLLSSNSGSGANSTAASASTAVSKYARILFSFYWVSILELGRTFVPAVTATAGGSATPSGSETPRARSSSSATRDRAVPPQGQHLFCIRVQVSARTAKELRKNERLKSLFPFVITDLPAASSGDHGGGGGGAGAGATHFSSTEAESLETMCRLAHARAQAEKRADSSTASAAAAAVVPGAIRRVPSMMQDEEQSASILSPSGVYMQRSSAEHSRLSIAHPSASPPAVNFYSPDASPIASTRRVTGATAGTPGSASAAAGTAAPLPSFPFSLAMPPAGSPVGAAAAGGAGASMVAPTPLLRVAQQLHQPGQH